MIPTRASRLTRLTLLILFVSASTSNAIEFSLLSPTTVTVLTGDTVTLDIAIDNLSETSVTGLTATITGRGFVALSGQSASTHFAGFCSISQCFAGASTVDNAFFNPNDLSASGAYTPGDESITIVQAVALSPTMNTGEFDPGLDGGFLQPSARDVTITLLVTPGPFLRVWTIGGTHSGAQIPIASTATLTLNVFPAPEPGTAVLLGLGLTGLGWARRRA